MNKKEKQNFLILASHEASEKEKQEKNTEYNSGTALLLGGGASDFARCYCEAKPKNPSEVRSRSTFHISRFKNQYRRFLT